MQKYFGIIVLICLAGLSSAQEIVKENLGPTINTTYNESKPIISPDGKILFFARQNYPDNFKGDKDPQDIYYSIYTDGSWSKGVNIGFPLNDKYPNGVNSVSTDGNSVLVINAYNQDGSVTPGASISHKSGSSWGYPKKLVIENFYNDNDFVDYYEANNGNHLLMAIERKDGMGDQDLYVSVKIDEFHWSEPVNLGSDINTSEAEFSPFLAADDKTLFFASMGFKGKGSSDIYYSKRLDDTWTKWSQPINLGPEVNSEEFEGYYSIPASGNFAYFVSTKDAINGSKDIYKVTLPYQFRPDPVLLISGTVYSEKTKGPVEAEIAFLDLPERKEVERAISSPERGDYKMVLPRGHIYEYLAVKEGYIGVVQYKDMSAVKEYVEIESDLALVPMEVGQKVNIHNIFFEPDIAKFSQDAYLELDRFTRILKENPRLKVEISGHCTSLQLATDNLNLSEKRAQSVVDYFVQQGIHPARFVVVGYGGTIPFNATEKIHFKPNTNINDRIEMKILATDWVVPIDKDADDDGVLDDVDECPTIPGTKATNGCPDTDGDLIIDKFDDCPRLAGVKENNGCPEITKETKEVLQEALRGIEFELGSDVIRPVSYVILDKVVDIMQQNPDYNLKISGHTDDQGDDDSNLILSHKRAQATKKYLMEHGVEERRLDAIGYGETKPVADNSTAEGRAQNRRVEFNIVFEGQNK